MTDSKLDSLTWNADILEGFEAAAVGGVTVVRPVSQPPEPRAVILHVHGYNDYFFQTHLAQQFLDAGMAFYAVDLRASGRSLKPGEIPHFMRSITEPGDDLDVAVAVLAQAHPGLPLVVHAHSTAGLTSAIWAADRAPRQLAALILNSPLLGRRYRPLQQALMGALPLMAAVNPRMVVARHPSVYASTLHVSGGGEWEFETAWKRPGGLPARSAWIYTVRKAQARIARGGVRIDVPVLVAHSARTGKESFDNPHRTTEDIVVDVTRIAELAPQLGPDVTTLVVNDAVHELSLSAPGPRAEFFAGMFEWLERKLP